MNREDLDHIILGSQSILGSVPSSEDVFPEAPVLATGWEDRLQRVQISNTNLTDGPILGRR